MPEYKDWHLRPDGNLDLTAFVGFATATLPDGRNALMIEYESDPVRRKDDPRKLQVGMSRFQLDALIQALRRMAAAPHIEEPPTDSRH